MLICMYDLHIALAVSYTCTPVNWHAKYGYMYLICSYSHRYQSYAVSGINLHHQNNNYSPGNTQLDNVFQNKKIINYQPSLHIHLWIHRTLSANLLKKTPKSGDWRLGRLDFGGHVSLSPQLTSRRIHSHMDYCLMKDYGIWAYDLSLSTPLSCA